MPLSEFSMGIKEIFKYKELMKQIITVSMNEPKIYVERVYSIFNEFLEMVDSFNPYTIHDLQAFIDTQLIEYAEMPYFPTLTGLYINALLHRLYRTLNTLYIDLDKLCSNVISDAYYKSDTAEQDEMNTLEIDESENNIGYSLDFMGYLLPEGKILEIKGALGEYCGARMEPGSKFIIHGQCGRNFGFERDKKSIIKMY